MFFFNRCYDEIRIFLTLESESSPTLISDLKTQIRTSTFFRFLQHRFSGSNFR